MAHTALDRVMQHVRMLAAGQGTKDRSDGELLHAFATGNDQKAFAALVKRHGPLVFAVCRQVLHQLQDAEDALQATFIVLARRAASLARKESLSGWLHCVSHRIALNARKAAARRRRHEAESKMMKPRTSACEVTWSEVQLFLDEEIQRLPERLREPFILCCLEGQTCAGVTDQRMILWLYGGQVSGNLPGRR
jgi:RNA polymerase sigma factor (sigma-70 family)